MTFFDAISRGVHGTSAETMCTVVIRYRTTLRQHVLKMAAVQYVVSDTARRDPMCVAKA